MTTFLSALICSRSTPGAIVGATPTSQVALQLAQAGHAPPPYKVVNPAQPTAPYAVQNGGFDAHDVNNYQYETITDLNSDYARLKQGQNMRFGDYLNPVAIQQKSDNDDDYMSAIVRDPKPDQRPDSDIYLSIAN